MVSRKIPRFQRPSRQPSAAAPTSAQVEMRVPVHTIMAKVGQLQLENDELTRQRDILNEQLQQALAEIVRLQSHPAERGKKRGGR